MPMKDKAMHGGNDLKNLYCIYCTTKDGRLKSREEVRQGWINAVMGMRNIPRKQAEKEVDEQMKKMPAWKKG
ncbi:hypothetical protein A3K72_03340 [Candidatus Woesearchaeota archaeon RBG_13_36_6]|nr:MAG: hypothetical protein A3K72_03340 [Candidatus Woesearchaeota archaeon RBG_13_36_6]